LRYFGVSTLIPLHSTLRTLRTQKSEPKHSLEIPKRNLSDFDENSVISFQMEIFRRLYALTTPFYTPNVAHANFRAETVPVNP
jgi:hypothetical protein